MLASQVQNDNISVKVSQDVTNAALSLLTDVDSLFEVLKEVGGTERTSEFHGERILSRPTPGKTSCGLGLGNVRVDVPVGDIVRTSVEGGTKVIVAGLNFLGSLFGKNPQPQQPYYLPPYNNPNQPPYYQYPPPPYGPPYNQPPPPQKPPYGPPYTQPPPPQQPPYGPPYYQPPPRQQPPYPPQQPPYGPPSQKPTNPQAPVGEISVSQEQHQQGGPSSMNQNQEIIINLPTPDKKSSTSTNQKTNPPQLSKQSPFGMPTQPYSPPYGMNQSQNMNFSGGPGQFSASQNQFMGPYLTRSSAPPTTKSTPALTSPTAIDKLYKELKQLEEEINVTLQGINNKIS